MYGKFVRFYQKCDKYVHICHTCENSFLRASRVCVCVWGGVHTLFQVVGTGILIYMHISLKLSLLPDPNWSIYTLIPYTIHHCPALPCPARPWSISNQMNLRYMMFSRTISSVWKHCGLLPLTQSGAGAFDQENFVEKIGKIVTFRRVNLQIWLIHGVLLVNECCGTLGTAVNEAYFTMLSLGARLRGMTPWAIVNIAASLSDQCRVRLRCSSD